MWEHDYLNSFLNVLGFYFWAALIFLNLLTLTVDLKALLEVALTPNTVDQMPYLVIF